jgi:hypothetical protein
MTQQQIDSDDDDMIGMETAEVNYLIRHPGTTV